VGEIDCGMGNWLFEIERRALNLAREGKIFDGKADAAAGKFRSLGEELEKSDEGSESAYGGSESANEGSESAYREPESTDG
jgi:hypothetical protein